ncbi:MAG TPA: hypothetical protein VEP48_07915 [Methylomirabilota bacterium]|nr:hypothetical protein [Methylomirabilota bacterium]
MAVERSLLSSGEILKGTTVSRARALDERDELRISARRHAYMRVID